MAMLSSCQRSVHASEALRSDQADHNPPLKGKNAY